MVECQPALYQPNQNNSTTITSTEKGTTSIEIKLQNIYGSTPISFKKEITKDNICTLSDKSLTCRNRCGCKINTVQVVEVLRFHIQEDLKWNSHVTEMTKKGAKRLYFLLQLKRAKVQAEEPVQFYVACIQSVLPHGCQVCHFSLPQYLTITFERILKRARRTIFGYEVHCSDALSRSGLVTLEQRRTELCKKLFNKIGENPLDILHPLIPFNEGPSKALRNSRS